MGQARDLKILLWKNCLTRGRQVALLVTEILWPLAWFVILASIRSSNLISVNAECHFNGRALPSAGLIPFIQSAVCSLPNTCNNQSVSSETPGSSQLYSGAGLNNVIDSLFTTYSQITPAQQSQIQQLIETLVFVSNQYPLLENSTSSLQSMNATVVPLQLVDLVTNLTVLESQISTSLPLSPSLVQQLSTASFNPEAIYNDPSIAISALTLITQASENGQSPNGTLVRSLLCGTSFLQSVFSLNTAQAASAKSQVCNLTDAQLSTLYQIVASNVQINTTEFLSLVSTRYAQASQTGNSSSLASLQQNVVLAALNMTSLIANLMPLFNNISSTFAYVQSQLPLENGSFSNNISTLGSFFCNQSALDVSAISSVSGGLSASQLAMLSLSSFNEVLQDQANSSSSGPAPDQPTAFCSAVFSSFDGSSNPLSSMVWASFKPFVRGKIPYAPDTPLTRQIVAIANRTFDNAASMLQAARDWLDISTTLRTLISTSAMQSVFTQIVSNCYTQARLARQSTWSCQLLGNFLTASPNVSLANNVSATQTLFSTGNQSSQNWLTALVLANNVSGFTLPQTNDTAATLRTLIGLVSAGNPTLGNFSMQYLNQTMGYLGPVLNNPQVLALSNSTSGVNSGISQAEALSGGSLNLLSVLSAVDRVSQQIINTVSCFDFDKFVPLPDEATLESWGGAYITQNRLWGAIYFNVSNSSSLGPNQKPTYLSYKIRMDQSKVDSTDKWFDTVYNLGPRSNPVSDLKYLTYGFAYLEDMLERAFIEFQVNATVDDGVYMQQFPYPCYIQDQFVRQLRGVLPMFMVLAWIFSSAVIIKSVVHEREQQLKVVMRVMGLRNATHWFAWFVSCLAVMMVSLILMIIILSVGRILPNSDPTAVFVYLFSYVVVTLVFSFVVSQAFQRANVAAVTGGVFFFVTYLPYVFVTIWSAYLSPVALGALSLLSNVAVAIGCRYISELEMAGPGLQWSNIAQPVEVGNSFTVLDNMLIMWLDTFLYLLLLAYIDLLKPIEKDGCGKPWYYPFTFGCWCKRRPTRSAASESTSKKSSAMFDSEPEPNLPISVQVERLCKSYGRPGRHPPALNDVSLTFYDGQISGLLGHNGAGKSTFLSILTGLIPLTSGSVKIYGHDLESETAAIRRLIGFCPQHNLLFDYLTVEEHILFYGRLKGVPEDTLRDEVDRFARATRLSHKLHALAHTLSGGMKRKLSIAIAFIGDRCHTDLNSANASGAAQQTIPHKLIILDEPTAGVDPHARRAIWDLIVHFKRDNTILLTTHHMDEADILSDRIFIVSRGMLCTVGSNAFLKHTFGMGYYLTLVRAPNEVGLSAPAASSSSSSSSTSEVQGVKLASDTEVDTQDVQAKPVIEFLRRFVPTTVLVGSSPTEFTFLLPTNRQHDDVDADGAALGNVDFVSLFRSLDGAMSHLGLSSYGLSDTTLEEVFIKIVSDAPAPSESTAFEKAVGRLGRSKTPAGVISDEALERGVLNQTDGGSLPHPTTRLSFRRNGSKSSRTKDLGSKQPVDPTWTSIASTKGQLAGSQQPESTSVSAWSAHDSLSPLAPASGTPKTPAHESEDIEAKTIEESASSLPLVIPNLKKATGLTLHRMQLHALLMKRWTHLKRSKVSWIAEILLPIFFVLLALIVSQILPSPVAYQEPLTIIPWLLAPAPKVNDGRLLLAYSNDNYSYPLANRLEQLLLSNPASYSTRCLNSAVYSIGDYPCMPENVPTFGSNLLYRPNTATAQQYEAQFGAVLSAPNIVLSLRNTLPLNNTADAMQLPTCACGGSWRTFAPPVASQDWTAWLNTLLGTNDELQQLTGHNLSMYLVETNQQYESYLYGAYSFGATNPLALASQTVNTSLQQAGASLLAYVPVQSLSQQSSNSDAIMQYFSSSIGRLSQLPPDPGQPPSSNASSNVVNSYMLAKSKRLAALLDQFFAGSYTSNNQKVWFNNKGYLSSVAYLNGLNNLRLRAYVQSAIELAGMQLGAAATPAKILQLTGLPSLDLSTYGITMVSHPLNLTLQQYASATLGSSQADEAIAISLIFALAFLPASFVMYLISDRVSKAKLLQFLTGLSPMLYWAGNFLWDYMNYCISVIAMLIVFAIFGQSTFLGPETVGVFVSVLFAYGFAAIPLLYPFTFVFKVPSTAFIICSSANLFLGSLATLSTVVLESFDNADLNAIGKTLKLVFPIFPQYCLGRTAIEVSIVSATNDVLTRIYGPSYPLISAWSWDRAGKFVLYLLLEGVGCCILTIVIQYRRELSKCYHRALGSKMINVNESAADEDVDVARERLRVLDAEMRSDESNVYMCSRSLDSGAENDSSDVLRLVNLTKVYNLGVSSCKMKRFAAVRGLSIGLRRAECFGLLGVNGAGKTTTFKMLTGDVTVTDGDALLNGHSIRTDMDRVRSMIGYCPQFDALNSKLTGAEHLDFFARIRGIGAADRPRICAALVARLGLSAHAHKLTQTYSGGTKRKLSTAIALLGQPKVLYLDEPTSGMDPKARRFLWDVLRSVLDELRCTVVLTTHSMDECEALCTRIAIMVNGAFKCLGSVTHLKNRFGGGYMVQVRLKHQVVIRLPAESRREVLSAIADDLRRSMPVILKDSQNTLLEFHLPNVRSALDTDDYSNASFEKMSNASQSETSITLAEVFERLEALKTRHADYIVEYSVCQTSLDHVFIHFAKMQTELRDAGYDDENFAITTAVDKPSFTDIAQSSADNSSGLDSSSGFHNPVYTHEGNV